MVTSVKERRPFRADGKVLIVGMPGMGRVGQTAVEEVMSASGAKLVAHVYSTYFPSQVLVGRNGRVRLMKGDLYESDKAIFFIADTQPHSAEGQNEVAFEVLKYLVERGVKAVVAGAAFVMPEVSTGRRVFVAGNEEGIIEEFKRLGAEPIEEGVISGINGSIIGWAEYFGIPGATILGESWSMFVDLNAIDYRGAYVVAKTLAAYLGIEADFEHMLKRAEEVEENIRSMAKMIGEYVTEKIEKEGKEHRPEVI